ncbi:MAG TPA: FtsH protease activity modulator HflK, partial [Thermoanaerobaculia bacterium]|nr:FtsH protease activity modulator HflK [Thermoanaerobaculia bacterium]
GIETVVKVPVERQLKEEFGFRTTRADVRTQYAAQEFDEESLMLTGDLNIADVEWVVQYRVVDPYKYLFRVRGVRDTFRAMTEAVVREVVGNRTVNEVLTVGRTEVAALVEQRLQDLADTYETGIKVEQVVLQNVNPPETVKPSFNEVNQAEQEKEEKINDAQRQYNDEIPRARGQAEQAISQAEGYALERVNRAEGEAARFNALFTEYQRAPEVTRKRFYLETMADILPKAGRKIVVDDEVGGLVPLLNLDGGPLVTPRPQPQGGGN